jgi:predicted O-methyltransferase YrrM
MAAIVGSPRAEGEGFMTTLDVPRAAPGYEFRVDWFSARIPRFERHLSHLKGRPCRILEIGAHEGRSTCWMVENIATHEDIHIDTIDVVEHPGLQRNLDATGRSDKITFHRGLSGDILRTLTFHGYDFVYIDGSHAAVSVLEDAVYSFRLLKAGGIMAFDDYLWEDKASRIEVAVDAFLSVYAAEIEILHHGYQVWVRKKDSTASVVASRYDWPLRMLLRLRRRMKALF